MMFLKRKKEAAFTNWVTKPDGTLVQSAVKVYVGENDEGVYEIEVSNDKIGIELETDFSGKHTIVKSVNCDSSNAAIKTTVAEGHILVAVNNHIVLNDEFDDIISYLVMLKESGIPKKMKFLDPLKCPLAVYEEKLSLQTKSERDVYGYLRSVEYLKLEREHLLVNSRASLSRDKDWVAFLKSVGGPEGLKPSGNYRPSNALKLLVRRGVPAAFRPVVWKHTSLSHVYRTFYPQNYYSSLVEMIPHKLNARVRDDIDKDLLRTFPDHEYFSSGKGLRSLQRVLCAYALHNPAVEYCQSLNFVAGTVLLYLEEEDGFWLFSTVLDCLLPVDQYTRTMIGTYVDQRVFDFIVATRFPALQKKLDEFQLQLSLVSVQWFMCLFVNTLRPEVALRVWDVFLNEGDKVLFRIAVALLHLHLADLLAAENASDFYARLKRVGAAIINPDILLAAAYKDFDPWYNPQTPARRSSLFSRRPLLHQVPAPLEGIGLAHVGPSKCVTPPVADIQLPQQQDRNANELDTGLRPVRNLWQRSKASSIADSVTSRRVSRMDRDYYRSFKREDIDNWRRKFRPEIEESMASLARTRQAYLKKNSEEEDTIDHPMPSSNEDDETDTCRRDSDNTSTS
mmetsp:Transcript_22565/g.32990  ORF Transcript_22565/g.32990 Transcript_22565/m.32990 type:complete len:622 (-) Transcript_22565:66-1931(-)